MATNPQIPASNQSHPILPPAYRLPFVDPQSGILSTTGLQFLQQIYAALAGTGGLDSQSDFDYEVLIGPPAEVSQSGGSSFSNILPFPLPINDSDTELSTDPVVKNLTISADTTFNWLGINEYRVTLTATPLNIIQSGAIDGQLMLLTLIQDAVGNRVVNWGTEVDFGAAVVPTLSVAANLRDHFLMSYNKVANKYDVILTALGF